VRALEAAYQVSNSHRFGWCGSLVAGLAVSFVVSVGCDAVACRSELVWGAAPLGFGVSCFVVGAGCGGGASWALVPGSNTALKLTWLSGGGKQRLARIR
jgi:hypothetical protein